MVRSSFAIFQHIQMHCTQMADAQDARDARGARTLVCACNVFNENIKYNGKITVGQSHMRATANERKSENNTNTYHEWLIEMKVCAEPYTK